MKTITDSDYADDIALLVNAPTQAETPLHSLERVAACVGLQVNAHKMEYMCFNQTGNISTLNSSSGKTSSTTKEAVSHQPRQTSTGD